MRELERDDPTEIIFKLQEKKKTARIYRFNQNRKQNTSLDVLN